MTFKEKFKNFFKRIFSCSKHQKTFSSEEDVVREAKDLDKIYIMYKDTVYDVTDYIDSHPGGSKIL